MCGYTGHMQKSFRDKVITIVKKIPKGSVLTYGDIAKKAGNPNAARAVGTIMRANNDKNVPCHRVIGKSNLGGYNGLRGNKANLLKREGYRQ